MPDSQGVGYCRAHPPLVLSDYVTQWPRTTYREYCGEFKKDPGVSGTFQKTPTGTSSVKASMPRPPPPPKKKLNWPIQ